MSASSRSSIRRSSALGQRSRLTDAFDTPPAEPPGREIFYKSAERPDRARELVPFVRFRDVAGERMEARVEPPVEHVRAPGLREFDRFVAHVGLVEGHHVPER